MALSLTPASGSVGAVVHGVDLRSVDDPLADMLRDAWSLWGVLFFRGQHLTPAEQAAAARIFGEPDLFDMAPIIDEQHRAVHAIDTVGRLPSRQGGASSWHSDASWKVEPPRGSMLQAIQLPQVGGDTLFASASAAYDSLSSGMRRMIDELSATHHGGGALSRAATRVGEVVPEEVHHPVVRVHPDSGARCLYVNRVFTQRIDDIPRAESDLVLRLLCEQFHAPEVQCRFHWEPGDVAVWDNRAVQHYATPDYTEDRMMHRVVLAGEPVVGIT